MHDGFSWAVGLGKVGGWHCRLEGPHIESSSKDELTRLNAHHDRTLGDFIELMLAEAEEVCPSKSLTNHWDSCPCLIRSRKLV